MSVVVSVIVITHKCSVVRCHSFIVVVLYSERSVVSLVINNGLSLEMVHIVVIIMAARREGTAGKKKEREMVER